MSTSSKSTSSKRKRGPVSASSPAVRIDRPRKSRRFDSLSVLPEYIDNGDCSWVCEYCGALFWYAERALNMSTTAHPRYTHCCRGGTVILPYPSRFPSRFIGLYESRSFLKDVRAYNSMFSMTSFGANVDEDVNDSRGPYVFKVSGQISHKIGSLLPDPAKGPRFLQLYLFDTDNEVENRLRAFDGRGTTTLDSTVISYLSRFLAESNEYVRTFKNAKQMAEEMELESYAVRLFNHIEDRRYDLPLPGSLGCIVNGDDTTSTTYDIIVHSRDGHPQRISKLHPSYMPLQYPLLFPFGEEGWSPRLKLANWTDASAQNLTVNMYYAYHIHARRHIWSPIMNSSRLFQQYLVDAYTCIEESRLSYIVKHQSNLRSDFVSGLYDALSKGDRDAGSTGKRIFLPASFTGGPRFMYSHYLDALSICRVYGNPQYFITFTCNVKWPEISRYMETHHQTDTHSRADIISRVFNIKVREFIRFLKEDKSFGDVEAYLYTIEFQKRGLPHCHTLLWVSAKDRIKIASDIDKYITAELPDPVNESDLYNTITTCMIHGPCGPLNQKAACMKEGKCNKHFPKPFVDATFFDTDGYARYKRNSTAHHTTQFGQIIDNGYVVPYNKRLCSRFRAHINVEYCGWSMLIKYLFKYISKGADRVKYVIQKQRNTNVASTSVPTATHRTATNDDCRPINEVHNYLDGRYICPHEAAWRILDFHIHQRYPPVQILTVHEENKQQIVFDGENSIPEVLSNPYVTTTTLLGWFKSNSRDPEGRHLTYLDYPKNYKWDKGSKSWDRRVYESSKMIGRLVFVHPTSGELFYLRMLLCHQKGCTSFKDLRTVAGTVYPTYRDACNALRLIGDDVEWLTCFTEAVAWATASQLRTLFCHLLLFCDVSNPLLLWNTACDRMKDDYLHTLRVNVTDKTATSFAGIVEQQLLTDLDDMLRSAVPSKSMRDFGLPVPSVDVTGILQNRLLLEEITYDREALRKQHVHLLEKLNYHQRLVYNDVISSIDNNQQALIFVYGHGGTGKTFLWTTILFHLRSMGKIALAVAASGIASLLLPSGTTAHSRFKIPIDLNNKRSCDIKKGTFLGDLLQQTTLILWDESPMSDRRCFEYLDRSLRDVLSCEEQPFGGISVLLGGDFRQTLPVVPRSTRSEIIGLSLPSSYLWPYFKIMFLHTNMRLQSSNTTSQSSMSFHNFATWLLDIGDGNIGVPDKDDPQDTSWIQIPPSLLISPSPDSLQTLIDFVYGDDTLNRPTASQLSERAIVCPTNDAADEINSQVLKLVNTVGSIYNSTDSMQPNGKHTSDLEDLYPIEYLNQLTFPGIPPHELHLKVDCPIMLLRNINQKEGLCNGTRLILSQLLPTVIEATIITGTSIGKRVYIPRIKFIHNSSDLPFVFSRKQFPVKVCYAMTINKSQGQSLRKIGIYLPQPVFAHGQLYVALSRATSPDSIRILLNTNDNFTSNETKNVVYRDLLHKVTSTVGYSMTPCPPFKEHYCFSFY